MAEAVAASPTDADLVAGAEAAPAAEPMAAAPDVAATMMMPPETSAQRESTTLMPAWSPPPVVPAAVAETMAIDRNEPPAQVAPGAGVQGELMIETGPDAGHSHRASDHPLRLGRSPDNDVILRDPATSGHHARVEQRGDEFWIVDLGSTNGTLVNGEPIQEKQLNHGDRITVGQNAVQFSVLGA
ncbi:MAG: FHA domain-containing protein [Candidatus Dormibacteraceae bacterium]